MYDQQAGEFKLRPGPLFTNVLLADEINRAPPKTQAALLEAMEEKQVTIEGITHKLPAPFITMATQNPIEQEGTYPLPEAQLDRFMFNILINYPSMEEEVEIVKTLTTQEKASLTTVISQQELQSFQDLINQVPVSENVIENAVKLVSMTRPTNELAPQITKDWLDWGAGPRASTFLIMAAQAKCLLAGKSTPDIDDIKDIGFKFATQSGTTIAIKDIVTPPQKQSLLSSADQKIRKLDEQYMEGMITETERYQSSISVWEDVSKKMETAVSDSLPNYAGIYSMADSGAKGNLAQIKQMAGMRGLMSDPKGRIIELPIRSSFAEGLSVMEYFISTHGARKGLADTALRTADSGYLCLLYTSPSPRDS
mgnify:CR=1 FL=1